MALLVSACTGTGEPAMPDPVVDARLLTPFEALDLAWRPSATPAAARADPRSAATVVRAAREANSTARRV
jgi:hypothetical protein